MQTKAPRWPVIDGWKLAHLHTTAVETPHSVLGGVDSSEALEHESDTG